MCRIRRHLHPAPLAAALLVAVLAAPAGAAITVPTAAGGVATITQIASVDTAKIVGALRWADPLGNVKTATGVVLRPQVTAAASLARGLLSKRLIVGTVVAAMLFETLSAKLGPDTQISADGTPQIVVSGTPVTTCQTAYIKVPAVGTTTPTVSAYGYLPCAYATTAPTAVVVRVPINSAWQPSPQWLNQYGSSKQISRFLPFVLQGADHADVSTGFFEYTRPQSTTTIDVPTSSVQSMSDAQQAQLLMDPVVIGQLAQNDAIPADFFQPVDTSAIGVDPNTTTSGATVTDDGSTLPDGPSMSDVSSSAFNVMSFVPGLSVRWLPRSCPAWPPIKIDLPQLHLVGSYDWPNDRICAVATSYISPVMQIAGVMMFLGIVFRKFSGGE